MLFFIFFGSALANDHNKCNLLSLLYSYVVKYFHFESPNIPIKGLDFYKNSCELNKSTTFSNYFNKEM